MPPEPLPWDNNRRGDFRRQQHDRSGSEPRGFGFGSSTHHRWRENYHHNHNYHHGPLPHAPPPSSYHHQQQQRWYSDFRNSRPLPHPYPGHGKQGGWHTHPDDAANGFVPFGSRYGDRSLEDENCRPYGSRGGGDGRYFRNSRDNRGSFVQKEWRTTSWEPAASPRGIGGPNIEANSPRPAESTRALHDNCHKSSENSRSQPDAMNSSGQSQSVATEQLDSNGITIDRHDSSDQKLDKRDCLESIDWKPLKWSRTGSLNSRGSGLSKSSCGKSIGVESMGTVAEVHTKITAVHSPSADAGACSTSAVAAPSDDNGSRKKPRLGWGEGLAKYEKKKVEDPEDGTPDNGLAVSIGRTETLQSPVISMPEVSPRVANLSACASPATPSSVACSSSPGVMEKESIKKVSLEKGTSYFSSPGIISPTNCDGPAFGLENLDLTSIANLSSSIDELLRSSDQSAAETGYVGTCSMNKLMVWKVDILKALEITESEIDSLETELKSFGSETRSDHVFATGSSLQLAECPLQACEESCSASHFAAKPISSQIVPSGDTVMENAAVALEHELDSKNEEFDSPSSATSKFVEVLPAGDDRFLCESGKCLEDCVTSDCKNSSYSDKICLNDVLNDGGMTGGNNNGLSVINTCEKLETVSNTHFDAEDVYDAIITSNKEIAGKAWEEFGKLLPANQCNVSNAFNLSCSPRSSSVAKDKYLTRKRFLRFKEKVLAIKYKVFQHFYKQGRVVSVRKLKLKAHKKFDLSLTGLKRKRSSSRFRVLSPAGDQQTVPTSEVIEYVQSLLLQLRPCRNILKMPSLILDKEIKMSRFVSTNGLTEDPCAVENERFIINPWTIEEKEIFIDKLSAFGKDFRTIASFLDQKTTADCIEFYYKNHKSEFFEKARKKPESMKQRKSQSSTYLIAYGNKWNRESNAASLDILGAASAMAATGNNGLESQRKYTSSFVFPTANSSKALRNDGLFRRSYSPDFYSYERETVAADVLAGICSSFSSEAVSSCSVDRGCSSLEWMRSHRVRASMRRSLTPEIKPNRDDVRSDEGSEHVGLIDWTDEEKSLFIHALSSYGRDFTAISQCVQTRSRDQCNLFYSKTRKRLGLDLIQPGARNCVDVNGTGGDDSGDAYVMETGSVVCNNGSESMVEGDLPPCDVKSSHVSAAAGTSNVMSDSNMCDEASEPRHSVSALPVSNDKFKGSSNDAFLENKVESKEENVENKIDTSVRNGLCETAVNRVENSEAKSDGASGSNFAVSELKSGPNLATNESQSSEELHSSEQNVSDLKIEKSTVNLQCNLQRQNDHLESIKASTLFSVPIKYQNILSCDALAVIGANEIRDSQKAIVANDSRRQIPCSSLSDYVDSSQILKGYTVSVQTVKDINGDVNCRSAASHESVPKRNGKFHSDHYPELLLRKCNGPSQKGGKAAPYLTPELGRNCHIPPQSVSSSEVDKPSSKGDVKLFGKILVSSQHKLSSRQQQETAGHSLDLNRNVSSDSSTLNLDSDNRLGSENVPLCNGNLWDGNHMQIGYPPLSDSARLLAKYPAAFSNHHLSTVKLGQSQLNGTISGSNDPLNGVSVLSNKEFGNNVLGNYTPLNSNGDLQNHFVVDTQQRKKGFDLMSGLRQQGRANIGINGNFVGGQCPVVSDPVAAIKLHFAKQMERNFKEDDNKWTSKGDLGR